MVVITEASERRSGTLTGARPTSEDDTATTFELFFDLVYVFAMTQVTGYMVHAHDALGGRGCWVNASRVRFIRSSLASGGKGALLTALAYSAVRSHQAVRAAGFPLPKERAEGGTHRPCAKCIDRSEATQGAGYAPKLVEGLFCELRFDGDREALARCGCYNARTLYSGKVRAMTP